MGIYSLINPSNSRQISTLIDTGALKANFVSEEIASWLTSHGDSTERVESKRRCQVCSVNECTMADRIISFKLEYFNQAIQQCQTITISAWVLPNLPCDIIIGRQTIEEERLLRSLWVERNTPFITNKKLTKKVYFFRDRLLTAVSASTIISKK